MIDQLVGMQISILQGSASGISVYKETQSPSTNANGLVSIAIGEGSTNDDFSSIDWADGPYFVKTETDPTGGSNYTISGTSQLLSVPYAMHAKTAENTFSGDYNDLNNRPSNISSFNNDAGYITTLNDDDATNELPSCNSRCQQRFSIQPISRNANQYFTRISKWNGSLYRNTNSNN